MQDVLVTIILPVYNGQHFIERSIKSVLNQTYSNIELIVINDGSIDDTENIVFKMQEEDARIKYYKIPNSGVSIARNIGLEESMGEYVGFIDSDDYFDSTLVEILLDKAKEYQCDVVSCLYEKENPDRNIKQRVFLKPGFYDKSALEEYVYTNLFEHSHTPLNIVTKLFKNTVIKKNSLKFSENLKVGEDTLFTEKFLLHTNSFYFIDDLHLYCYVHNNNSATNKYYPDKWKEIKKTILARRELIEDFPQYQLNEQYYLSILNRTITAFFNVFKNSTSNRNLKIKELENIIKDPLLKSSLRSLDFSKLTKKKKLLCYLIKKDKIKAIYILFQLYSFL